MSLNSAHAGKDGVILFNTERLLIFYDGVQMAFDDVSDDYFKGKKSGKIYLTTHRVIFANSSKKDKLLSLSIPFYCLSNLDLEQPVFGANYITGKIQSEHNGGWNGKAKFKLYFNKGGAIEFGKAMMAAGKLASQNRPAQPPAYTPPHGLPYYQAPPPAFTVPSGQMYGFVPMQVFPDAPPPGSVFMFNEPPPYPGIDNNLPPYSFNNQQPFNMASGAAPPQPPSYQPQPFYQGNPGYPQQPGNFPPQQPNYNGYPQQPGNFPPQQPNYNGHPGAPTAPYQPPYDQAYNQQGPGPQTSAAAAKEAEAMGGYGGQGYFDPNNPQHVYMPPYQAPPPYNPHDKKEN